MSKAQVCPVCYGTGERRPPFDPRLTTGVESPVTCHGCHGKGWVEVSEPNPWPMPPPPVNQSDNISNMNRMMVQSRCRTAMQ